MHPDLSGFCMVLAQSIDVQAHGGHSSFVDKTPVTYAYLSATGMASAAALFMDMEHQLTLDVSKIANLSQYWRLLTCHFALDNGIAVAFGMYVLFQFRVIERQFGSNKFGTLVLLVLLTSTALQVWLKWPTTPGPYPLIGALFVIYFSNVPQLQPRLYSLLGLHVSDKASTYGLLSVVCLRSYATAFPFATGVLVGLLYQSKALPLSKLRLPGFLVWFFEWFHPIFMVVPPSVLQQQRQRQILDAQRRQAAAMGGHPPQEGVGHGFRDQLLPGNGHVPFQHRTPPSEDAINQLTGLGFERDQAIAALQASDNNVEAAANRLLNAT
ncbi:hypothetical protein, variant 1 [Aphanomyces astaci]|uniref:UBA domain-containing protein n=1 Tax=Aphanomyces astaci TaxID=112090 RepID=W4GTX7_APHAT|nr:hypothetical protein, variant 1 [Aphanomyces astaci]ETV82358.1 hypothetical protein, variant 1 [Aphanomyces astaci]|eukprot:XP_009828027.1 hypothetical protein, variant 1 [Aphanomyces astaci]